VHRGTAAPPNLLAASLAKQRQTHDLHRLIVFGALHKNTIDKRAIIPIIKTMLQRNIAMTTRLPTIRTSA
jgi:hypothetical protein